MHLPQRQHYLPRILLHVVLLFACIGENPVLGQGDLKESVVVTAYASPVAFENVARGVTVITREQIQQLPVQSVADLLRYVAGVDVRSRSPFGVQSDFSARGAGFGQILILLDGLRMNDAQTGHHDSDLPVALSDIERVEVLHGTGSSVYGADAFGAAINVVTRQGGESRVRISAGEHELVDGEARAVVKAGPVRQSISLFGNRSSGFMFDRDFRTVGLNSRTDFNSGAHLQFSHLQKEFGANGFYGPSPSKEWTNTTLVAFGSTVPLFRGSQPEANFFYRTHGDRFLWDVRRPGLFENEHRTHAAGAALETQHQLREGSSLTWGGEVGHDWIDSNNLGAHGYGRWGVFAELQQRFGNGFSLVPGVRFDQYSTFGSSLSPSLSAGWWVHHRLKLRSSAGHAFRIPTFTELYYSDPYHLASADLLPEEAWEVEAGADWIITSSLLLQASAFSRWDRNLIDWVRETADQRWRTANIRALATRGFEAGLRQAPGGRIGLLSVQYAYLSTATDSLDILSKYALDFARHSFSAFGTVQLPLEIQLGQDAHYRVRSDGRRYWVLNQKWKRDFRKLTAVVEVSNLLDAEYEEIRGVVMPGRWIRAGLEFRVPSF